ncbi:hypothetical protein AB833_28920 [Chromatiales bacterium (ex Bugula neritina AB1)]|nr:hypothetical protein AB833_28920 [Chromatiales bacterium (ex Bugula neritina AB1)]
MRNVTREIITETFMGYIGEETDPRSRENTKLLASHLHAFAKETRLTHEEWQKGLEILRNTG